MDYFPFFFDLKQQPCLIVGGGDIATRKARLLHKAQAKLIVVARDIDNELLELVSASNGESHIRSYREEDVEGKRLVIAATDVESVNAEISAHCHLRNVPVNVVDDPANCSIITPAVIDRSPLIIGVTSGGEAPVMARKVRSTLDSLIPQNYGKLAQLASKHRQAVKERFASEDDRRRFWESLLNGPAGERALAGDLDGAETMINAALSEDSAAIIEGGEVYLVGAGPGDPDLLTFKALRLMQQAEVVLYDRLVSPTIVDMCRRDAERIYVGKRKSEHAMEQQNINELLLKLAQAGKRVCRLKGGDPFIFGRGGEEIDLLADHGVPFQVVPGITAASGCASYSGIPLTHRDHSQSVRFITGHRKQKVLGEASSLELPWHEFGEPAQTLVFYMGLTALQQICAELLAVGRDKDTPVALVEKGTMPEQRTTVSTLEAMPALAKELNFKAPTLFIVGSVVSLHSKLSWFQPEKNASEHD